MTDAQRLDLGHVDPLSVRLRESRRGPAVTEAVSDRDPADLYRRLAPAVLGYLRSQGAEDPEDLLMDVFVAVVRDVHAVRGDDAAVRRWVFTIAHHRVVDERRRRSRRPISPEPSDTVLDRRAVPGPDSDGPDPELVAALARLTPEQRDVLGLCVVADLPVRDVAKILRKRPNTVTVMQRRATAKLAELLG